MATETGFQRDWLNERFTFDCKARNKIVEKACLRHFQDHTLIKIVDIGSGTGSNALYLMERFPQNQHWILVELNPELAKASLKNLQAHAKKEGYEVEVSHNSLYLIKAAQTISIQVVRESFLELDTVLDLNTFDLLTAGAVFDLLSESLLEKLLRTIQKHKIACLTTINYEGIEFIPAQESDEIYIRYYQTHMVRPQPFGHSLGPHTSYALSRLLDQYKIKFIQGESNWDIDAPSQKMHNFLLNYMEEGVTAMLSDKKTKAEFQTWLSEKRSLVKQQQLQQIVYHSDFFFHQ